MSSGDVKAQPPICVTLRQFGSGRFMCEAAGQSAVGGAGPRSLVMLCRRLLATGIDPARPVNVYSGGSLRFSGASLAAIARGGLDVDEVAA